MRIKIKDIITRNIYFLVLEVDKDIKTVTIIRIMYNGRDVDSQLNTLYNN